MKSTKSSGFLAVFSFTLKSHLKNKKFILTTVLFSLVIIAGIVAAIVLTSKPEDEKTDYKMVTEKIYVEDKTGYGVPDYAAIAKAMEDDKIGNIVFEKIDDARSFVDTKLDDDPMIVAIEQNENDTAFELKIITGISVPEDDIDILKDKLPGYFQNYVLTNSGLTPEEMVTALLPVESSILQFGEEKNAGKEIVTIISTFGVLMIVYFMIIFYGMSVCTEVSLEKTSKLVEQMLTNVSPYSLVAGKILGTILESVIQVLIWVGAAIVGLFAGNFLATSMYDIPGSKISFYFDTLKGWFKGQAFSAPSIILFVLLLLAGVVLYLTLAGFAGSLVTKPEEAPNMQALFMFPMMIAFFVVLAAVTKYEGNISVVYALIPFTGSMCAPGMILIGNLSLGMGLICLLVSLLCSALILWCAARIYKGLLFFSGGKLSPKTVWSIVRGK